MSSEAAGPASPGGQAVNAVNQVAALCRAVARLITAGLDEAGSAATAGAPSAGGPPPQVATSPGRQQGGAAPPATTPGAGANAPADPPAVATRVSGSTPTEGLGVAVASAGMILLVLTALIVHGLARGRADPSRWRSVMEGARAARQDLSQRGEVLPVVLLVAVSLVFWAAIALWVLTN